MSRSRVRAVWSNPGNPPAAVARQLGMEPRHFSRALHKIKAASDLPAPIAWSYIVMDRSPMSGASDLATSTTKTDTRTGGKVFVTLRFAGDDLDPDEISAILPVKPTRAHRKGEEFVAGPHAGKLRGRTGTWFLATDELVDSDHLGDHLRLVHKLLYPKPGDVSRIEKLRDILGRAHSHAHITCFWHGEPEETAPQIPDRFKSAIEPLAADIETDFGKKQ